MRGHGESVFTVTERLHMYCTGAFDCSPEAAANDASHLKMRLETWTDSHFITITYDAIVKNLIEQAISEYEGK